jgi:hypothetical protein
MPEAAEEAGEVIRHLLEQLPTHYSDLQAGQVVEVRWSRHHGYVMWISPTSFVKFFKEWGRFLDGFKRRDLFVHCHDGWLACIHDDGIFLSPINIEQLKKTAIATTENNN